MWNLNLRKYSPVYLKRSPIVPWIVNESAMEILKENAAFIKNLIKVYPQKPYGTLTWIQDQFDKAKNDSSQEEDVLTYFGLKTIGTLAGEFIDDEDYQGWLKTAEVALPTERFYSRPFMSLGSSRHVLSKSVQLKGVGRNNLCLDEDFYHSWGGLVRRDALKGYLSQLVADQKTKLGSLKILAMFNYTDLPKNAAPLTMVVRESDSFRLSQIDQSFLTDSDITAIKTHLKNKFPGLTPQQMLETILDHYVHAYSVGVVHRSPNRENLLIDGRWIDTESIDFHLENAPLYPYLKIFIPCPDTNLPEHFGHTLNEVIKGESQISFYDTWTHHLHIMCELTIDTYIDIYPSEIHFSDEDFWKLMETYLSHEELSIWREATFKMTSFNQMSFCRTTQDKLEDFTTIKQITPIAGDFKCIGHFYDYSLKGMVYTFSSVDEDIHHSVNKILRKWEVIFWPKKSSWEEAFQFSKTCKDSVQELIS